MDRKAAMDIGRRIRETREDLGMPRNELARRVGVAGNHLYMIESGSRMPSLGLVERVAHALRVTPADLVREEPENVLTSPKADVPDTGRSEAKPRGVPPIPQVSLAALSTEELETLLFGAPAREAEELAPLLTGEKADQLVRAVRAERDALEDWVEAYRTALPEDRLRVRREYVRAEEQLASGRLYYLVLLDYWSKLADPRDVPFKGVGQIVSESEEARGLMQAIKRYKDELRQIASSAGQAG